MLSKEQIAAIGPIDVLMIPVGGGFMAFFAVLDLLGWKKYKNTNQYGDQLLEASLDDGGQSAAN